MVRMRGRNAESRQAAGDRPAVETAELIQQHRDLDMAILSLEESGTGDQLQLRRLKKMKLDLKDKIRASKPC